MTITDRRQSRPPLPEGAGLNTIRLDLALTRDEIAVTMRQLVSKLNPRRLVTDNPRAAVVVASCLFAVAAGIAARVSDRTPHDG